MAMLKKKKQKNPNKEQNFEVAWFVKVLAIGFCLIMGCSKTENSVQVSGNKEQTEKNISDTGNIETLQPPIFITSSSTKRIDFLFNSEKKYCIYDGEHYGFMTESGKELTSYIYDIAYPYHEGLACASYKKKYGFIDLNGEEAISFIYDDAAPFMEGLAYFAIGNRYGFMDRKGNPVFYLECDSVSSFQEGLAFFSIDGKYGYIDKLGNTVIEPIYDDATYFQEGIATIVKDGKYGVIDNKGKEIIAPLYDYIDIDNHFIFAELNNQYWCFDSDGKKCLATSYDKISVDKEGRFCIQKNDLYGFTNSDGTIVATPQYDAVSLIPGKDLAIVENNGLYGIIDFQRNIKVPFIYHHLYYDYNYATKGQEEGILIVTLDNKEGCLNVTDFSECIPIIYDRVYGYSKKRLVVKQGEKYGVINQSGELEIPIQYDKVTLFDDGSVALEYNQMVLLFNSNEELIDINRYDSITKEGDYYKIEQDNKYNFLNKKGEKILSNDVSTALNWCYHTPDILVLSKSNGCDGILKTKDTVETDITSALLRNKITPRTGLFQEFVLNPFAEEKTDWSWGSETIENNGYMKDYKLYDIDGSGKPILYFSAQPYISMLFSLSDSGFYSIKDNQLNLLVTAHECGGSMGGDYVHLVYDKKTNQTMIGTTIHTGGFGGFADGLTIYSYKNKEALKVTSFQRIWQTTSNYEKDVLIENASMFYNDNGEPYSNDTILQAKSVAEYTINGTTVTKEEYDKIAKRYISYTQFHVT